MNQYLAFLLDKNYLERTLDESTYDRLLLTDKGERFLHLLEEIEGEIGTFRTADPRTKANDFEACRGYRQVTDPKDWQRLKGFLRSDREYQFSLALIHLYSLQGQVSDEESEIRRMLDLAQTLSDNSRLSEAHAWKSNHLIRVGMYQQAILEGQKALDFAGIAEDKSKIAGAQLAVGEASGFLGQKEDALHYFSEALNYYRNRSDRIGQANATRLIAQVYLKHGDYSRALDQANRALALFREIRDRVGEDESLRYIGDILCAQGDYLQALDYYHRVLKIRRDMGNRSREGGALGDIGDVYLSLGQYEKSLDLHRQALRIDADVGYRFGQVWDHHDLGVTQLNLGNLAQAREELAIALKQAKDINAPDLIALCSSDLSTVLRNEGGDMNLENALQFASVATKTGEIYSLVYGQITGESNMAMAHRALGNHREALYHSENAVKILERNSPTETWEEEILFNQYLILRDNRTPSDAKDYLKRARDKMIRKAEKIRDSGIRKTFLTQVSVNRRITSEWEGLDLEGSGSFPTLRQMQELF